MILLQVRRVASYYPVSCTITSVKKILELLVDCVKGFQRYDITGSVSVTVNRNDDVAYTEKRNKN